MVKKVQYFWKKRPAVSIVMIQVHYLEIKIAVLDRPYGHDRDFYDTFRTF